MTVVACLGVVLASPYARPSLPTAAAGHPPDECATAVIEDWADDGHVRAGRPLPCYREAISALPEDVRAYSSAPEDIKRALLSSLGPGAG